MSNKRAILIGCNYTATPSAKLQGCINDILNVSNVLIDAYGYKPANITYLRDDVPSSLPTRANILKALRTAMASSANYSELWIHYSGHGTQLKDTNADETDGMDEAIVPSDYTTAGMIRDDELFSILNTSKCRTLVFFDSCHSGSACDLPYSINYVNGSFSKTVSSRNTSMSNPNIIMMSGCRDPQTSADAYNNFAKSPEGAFTMCLLSALRKNDHTADIMKIYNDICASLIQQRFTQIPVLSSSTSNPSYSFARSGPVIIQQVSPVQPAVKQPVASSTARVLIQNMRDIMM